MIKTEIFDTLRAYGIEICEQTGTLINALYTSAIYESSISTVYHSRGDIEWKKKILKLEEILSNEHIITIETYTKFSKMTLNPSYIALIMSEEEWVSEKIAFKAAHMKLPTTTGTFRGTRVGKTVKDTGLRRPGFEKTLESRFSFDKDMLNKYNKAISMTLYKSLTKIKDVELQKDLLANPASYWEICNLLLEQYANSTEQYTQGNLDLDQRGRAVLGVLKYAFNPIANKDARALLVIPARSITTRNTKAIEAIYLFIAELIGNKTTNISEKIEEGERCYHEGILPDLKLFKESDRKDLHELIWLERIYAQLDALFETGSVYWEIPIEIDFTASMLAIDGILLGSRPHMNATNIINDDDLQDAWLEPKTDRLKLKTVMTPTLYGSSESYSSLLANRGLKITKQDLTKLTKVCKESKLFKTSTKFKDIIIKGARMKPVMDIKIGNDQFTIQCLKFKKQGAKLEKTAVYEPKTNKNRVVSTHTPTLVPDIKRFKLFTKTLLNHNVDSQLLDKALNEAYYQSLEWCITIHDAVLLHPLDVDTVRSSVRATVMKFYDNRESILREFCASIGIVYDKVMPKFLKTIEPVNEDDQFSKYAMK